MTNGTTKIRISRWDATFLVGCHVVSRKFEGKEVDGVPVPAEHREGEEAPTVSSGYSLGYQLLARLG